MLQGGLLLVLVLGGAGMQLAKHDKLQEKNVTNLALVAGSCNCQFSGVCSCGNALQFMKCIETACESGNCDCQPTAHAGACLAVQDHCPGTGLQCHDGAATCGAALETAPQALSTPASPPQPSSAAAEKEPKEAKAEGAQKEEGSEGGEKASHILFYSMLAFALMLTTLVALTNSSNKLVAGNTWRVIEQVILVFVAVLWYQAFDELLDSHGLASHHETLCHVLHALGLLVAAVVVSWSLRGEDKKARLAIFCGCGAHYVSFASMAAGNTAMANHFDASTTAHLLGLFAILAGIVVMLFIVHFLKKSFGMYKDDEWGEAISDVENDFAAMAFAVAFHLFVCHLIASGNHTAGEEYHPAWVRNIMLAYAIAMVVVGSLALKPLNVYAEKHKDNWFVHRVAMFATSFVAMSAAWAFLHWGEWEVQEFQFQGQPLLGKLAFANIVSFVACAAVVVAAKVMPRVDDPDAAPGWKAAIVRAENILIIALSLIVAWSWEETFDEAVEGWAEEDKNAHIHKILLAVGMGAVILPVYAICLRPIVASYSEEA